MANVQIVDIGAIGLSTENPTSEQLKSVGNNIAASFRESGFAYLKNHGLTDELLDGTFAASRAFFERDLDSKMCYERFVHAGYNGYTPIGGENTYPSKDGAAIIDYKECYDLRYLGEGHPEHGFGHQLETMAEAYGRLSRRLLRGLEIALGLEDTFTRSHEKMLCQQGGTVFRVLYYPPVPHTVPEATLRCGEHTDYGTISLLYQDSVGGLEIETSPGVWAAMDPIPGTIVCNIGDMMETWTGGQLRATKHRVLVPPKQHRRRRVPRQSMVFFLTPDEDVEVEPLLSDKANYKPVNAFKHVQEQYEATYPTFKNFIHMKGK